MGQQMGFEVTVTPEFLATNRTDYVQSVVIMCFLVRPEYTSLVETLSTNQTFMGFWSFFIVGQPVLFKGYILSKGSVANSTGKGLFSSVGFQMGRELRFCSESFSTKVADLWFLPCVGHHVGLQITLLIKYLEANFAPEIFIFKVDLHVRS